MWRRLESFTGNECRSGCPEGRGCSVILLYWKVYIYIYTHTVYPLACNRHRWFRMLDVSIDFCVAQHFSLAQQLDLPILNMTKVPVAHGHSLGTDWPTCMISTNTEDTVDGTEIWKKIRLTTWDGAKTLVKKWDFNYRSLIWWNRRISEPSTVAPRFCGTTSTVWILPRNLTWNLKITHWKRKRHLPNHHFWVPC